MSDTTEQLVTVAAFAATALDRLGEHFPQHADDPAQHLLKLGEEYGELAGAYLRYEASPRHSSTLEDVAAEAADVLITFYVFATSLALDACLGGQFPDYGPADVYADSRQHLLWLGARYGELTGACMRYLGRSRRGGTLEDVAAAAAGVLAYVHIFSASLGIDLEAAWRAKAAVIAARPWRENENGDAPALMFPKPPARRYTDAERQMLRDYMCPACRTSTLASGPRGRKHCTECGAEYTIPRRKRSR